MSADGKHYIGTDPAGRVTLFDPGLNEVYYQGTHHGFYLKFNDDGSIDKWGGEFVENPRKLEGVRPSEAEVRH